MVKELDKKMPEYCVTGGTGFIAVYLIKTLLERGHTVRATVRDPGMYIYICTHLIFSFVFHFTVEIWR